MSSQYDDNFDRTKGSPPPAIAPNAQPPYQQPQQASPVYGLQYMPPQSPKRRRRFHPACLGCLLGLIGIFGVMTCITLVVIAVAWNNLSNQLEDRLNKAQQLVEQQTFQTTRIYDRRGVELHELLGEGRRTKIKLADIPQYMIDATVAVEDSTFWENPGVDWPAIVRAGFQYFQGEASGGASTITQQLVRNIAFDYQYRQERSARRKLEEIMMALIITRQKSKDEILEMYLNQIYYGNLAYGVEAASLTYFGKHAKELNLAEASLLAGLPQTPAELDPLNPNPQIQDAVFARRKVVLDLMVDKGKISHDDETKALAQGLNYNSNPNITLNAPHFTLYAEQELKSLIQGLNLPPSYLATAGLRVYTTLDMDYQKLAADVSHAQIAAIRDQHNAHNAAVVILKPVTGEILAMVGSVDYNDDSIDGRVNVATSLKQPGSAMKPLTYAAAMEKGFVPASVLWDVETHIKAPGLNYAPVNYDKRFHGPVRLRDALANSYNVPAVQTLRTIGVDALLKMAQRMGVNSLGTDASKYGLSLTLGGGDLTLLELTQAYAIFANKGSRVSATSILCVVNSDGVIIYQYQGGCEGKGTANDSTINRVRPDPNQEKNKVIDERVAFVISDILADNVARSPAMGSNSPLRTDGLLTSVKTGTTNDYRDNWTVGFTRNVVVGVWVGNTDSKPMVNISGLQGAAPIWHEIITGIYGDQAKLESLKPSKTEPMVDDALVPPPGIFKRQICSLAALKDPAPSCPPGRSEWFFDTPPDVPDGSGKLVAQPRRAGPTRIPANANGPIIVDVDPGVAQTIVQPLDPGLAATLVDARPGQPGTPPPLYCLVPNEVKDQIPTAQVQFFIKPPPFPDQVVYARIYAQGAGVAMLPDIPCTPEMLVAQPQVAGASARITSPRPGQTVTGVVEVSGIASWQPGQAAFFKAEIQGPQFPNWTTFGQTHDIPVINGPLDHFGAEGLQPGTYKLRVVIVGVDGGYLLVSGEIPINVTGR
jgi:membrane peptidoglycan carboxypeptidase